MTAFGAENRAGLFHDSFFKGGSFLKIGGPPWRLPSRSGGNGVPQALPKGKVLPVCSEGLPPIRRSYIFVEGLPPLGAFADLGPRSTVPTTNREKRHRRFPILYAPSKRKGARRGGGLPSGERWPAAGAAIVLGQITSKNGAAQRAASIPQGLVL